MPEGSQVIFLGDGEFDGIALQTTIAQYEWQYVFRTAKNTILTQDGVAFSFADLDVWPGQLIELLGVRFTRQAYGSVLAVALWDKAYKEPLFLVSNLDLAEEACYWYKKRFRIETFFSDQKSRGFNLHKSHVSDPVRLSRLMIAACLAYIWIIYLGALAHLEGRSGQIHRTDRCDLSLFKLGLDLLQYFLDELIPVPVAFAALDLQGAG